MAWISRSLLGLGALSAFFPTSFGALPRPCRLLAAVLLVWPFRFPSCLLHVDLAHLDQIHRGDPAFCHSWHSSILGRAIALDVAWVSRRELVPRMPQTSMCGHWILCRRTRDCAALFFQLAHLLRFSFETFFRDSLTFDVGRRFGQSGSTPCAECICTVRGCVAHPTAVCCRRLGCRGLLTTHVVGRDSCLVVRD